MSKDFLSVATRNEFRETLVGFTLGEIEMMFGIGSLTPDIGYEPPVSGQRRSLVEQYYANIDFSNSQHIQQLVQVYEEIIEQLQDLKVTNYPDLQRTIDKLVRRMDRDGFRFKDGHFDSDALKHSIVGTSSLIQLSKVSITEHVQKAKDKIEIGDNAGAIASAYTLVEEFLKELLRRTSSDFKQDEGDIRKLYNIVSHQLNLNPSGQNLESYLKIILQGLKGLLSGLYEIANKASDRHARRYNPEPHHAKLAVNAAFTLCEFLLDSHEYQLQKKERVKTSKNQMR